MRAHRVRALLMGGQACVFYGAAEFSRDTDKSSLEANFTPWPPPVLNRDGDDSLQHGRRCASLPA